MSRQERIRAVLTRRFSPQRLDVIDESERHHGHAGWREGGETHFRVKISSALFEGQSRISRHRMVTDALAAEFASGLHALAIEANGPEKDV